MEAEKDKEVKQEDVEELEAEEEKEEARFTI